MVRDLVAFSGSRKFSDFSDFSCFSLAGLVSFLVKLYLQDWSRLLDPNFYSAVSLIVESGVFYFI